MKLVGIYMKYSVLLDTQKSYNQTMVVSLSMPENGKIIYLVKWFDYDYFNSWELSKSFDDSLII